MQDDENSKDVINKTVSTIRDTKEEYFIKPEAERKPRKSANKVKSGNIKKAVGILNKDKKDSTPSVKLI